MDQGYDLAIEVPSSADYRRLRAAAGLSPKSVEAAAAGLPNTLFAVLVRNGGRVIAMGRVVGDGGAFFQVVDIAVEPAHQRRGIGKAIMGAIVEHLRRTAPETAQVSLVADGDARHLYAQFGFEPTGPGAIAMAFRIGSVPAR